MADTIDRVVDEDRKAERDVTETYERSYDDFCVLVEKLALIEAGPFFLSGPHSSEL